MKSLCKRWLAKGVREDAGMLSFEWILLITLLVIGIVGGISAVRDAVISELGDVAGAVIHIDQSYEVEADATGWGNAFGFDDQTPNVKQKRPTTGKPDQGPVGHP
ncbi:MAG: hypothetical protein D6741_18995 [Planctomycetota bacterium]|nr:MAG: hypothetical protein D6741_18995 [Planctomycetota bacterium]